MKKNFYFMALASLMMLAGMNACKQKLETPPFAASTQTWTIAGRTWSDVIQLPECNDENGPPVMGVPSCECWYYKGTKQITYHYEYVFETGRTMCPKPWRLPISDEVKTAIDWYLGNQRIS
ncbi:MAG: hypothetical protein LBD87_05825, partial [Prevotellaceae bacterium]|nr:hypothetical protein [Prevotellaceae bacterium]